MKIRHTIKAAAFAVIFVLVLSSTGCTRKNKCVDVTEEAAFTEVRVEQIPVVINYSGPFKDLRIEREHVQVPLNYSVHEIEVGVGRFYYINETGYYMDTPRKDQIVTAYAIVQVVNQDEVSGNFTVNWNYTLDKWMAEQREIRLIEPGKNATFRLAANMTRGTNWSYSYTVTPAMKEIVLPYAVYETVNESGERTIFTYNRTTRTVMRNVTRTVCAS